MQNIPRYKQEIRYFPLGALYTGTGTYIPDPASPPSKNKGEQDRRDKERKKIQEEKEKKDEQRRKEERKKRSTIHGQRYQDPYGLPPELGLQPTPTGRPPPPFGFPDEDSVFFGRHDDRAVGEWYGLEDLVELCVPAVVSTWPCGDCVCCVEES